jgi:hypothetical protein
MPVRIGMNSRLLIIMHKIHTIQSLRSQQAQTLSLMGVDRSLITLQGYAWKSDSEKDVKNTRRAWTSIAQLLARRKSRLEASFQLEFMQGRMLGRYLGRQSSSTYISHIQ